VQLDEVIVDLPRARYCIGLVHMEGVLLRDSPYELRREIEDFAEQMLEQGCDVPEDSRKQIRRLLRQGGFKPTGRNRPASEYLARDLATRGSFHFINNLVDINNYLSLRYALPMSVLDAGVIRGNLHIRVGEVGENYIFNPSGQELDLKGLLLVADYFEGVSRPLGSPIKDSVAAKLASRCRSALVVVYSHPQVVSDLVMESVLQEWCELGATYAHAENMETTVLSDTGANGWLLP
jgi:DNA/RNA-binding domain of Phe-tRNA-synthetase-like protein